jgi:AcrR family transcriptional regulator
VSTGTDTAILRAAATLIAQRGYHGASMRDLGRAVGLQTASLYHHFGSKQELLVAIMREAMADLTACVTDAVDDVGDEPRAQLSAAIRAHIRFHTEHRPEVIVADAELRSLDEPGRTEIIALRDRHQALFRGPVERLGVEQAGIVTSAIITMCTDVAMWFRSDGPLEADDVAETYVALVLRGIEP